MLDHEKVANLEFYNWFLAALGYPEKNGIREEVYHNE